MPWLLILILILVWAIFDVWRKHRRGKYLINYPGSWPILGHLPMIIRHLKDPWAEIEIRAKDYLHLSKVLTLDIGPITLYIISDPDDFTKIANECIEKHWLYNFVKNWLGESLVAAETPVWQHNRKLLNPAFSLQKLNDLQCVFNSQAKRLVEQLTVEVDKGPFDHRHYVELISLETICITTTGVSLDGDFDDALNRYVEGSKVMSYITMRRATNPWINIGLWLGYSSVNTQVDKTMIDLRNLSRTIMQKRKLMLQDISDKPSFKSLLDYMFEAETDAMMNEEIIIDEIVAFTEAHEILAATMSIVLTAIGTYAVIQNKIYEELSNVFGNSERDIEKDDLPKLVYLEAFLKETMRLYTSAFVVGRLATKSVKLKTCTIPTNGSCILNIYCMQRNPKIWGEDAEEFKPERWLDPSRLPTNPNAFAPFSIGRRNCIGKRYAMVLMKTILAYLLRQYELEADITKMKMNLQIMLKPVSGHFIKLQKRSPKH